MASLRVKSLASCMQLYLHSLQVFGGRNIPSDSVKTYTQYRSFKVRRRRGGKRRRGGRGEGSEEGRREVREDGRGGGEERKEGKD